MKEELGHAPLRRIIHIIRSVWCALKSIVLCLRVAMEGEREFRTRKRRRGLQTRLHADDDERLQQSVLAVLLLSQLAWGIFSPAQVQDLANKAVQDMDAAGVDRSVFPDLYNLAKAGTFGKHPNNIHRDIMATVKDKVEFTAFEPHIPFKVIGTTC